MKALVLAAGKGKRMLPLTEKCPKALLPINDDNTVLDLIVQNCLRAKDIDEVIVVINRQQYQYFNDWNKYERVRVFVSPIEDNVIKCISYVINNIALQTVLIAAADNVLEFEIQEFIDFYNKEENKSAVMYYIENSLCELRRTGVAQVENGIVVNMEEKPEIPQNKCAIPPYYIIPKTQFGYIDKFLKSETLVDSLGTYLSWYVHETIVRAFLMPGKRHNIGDRESYLNYKNSMKIEGNHDC